MFVINKKIKYFCFLLIGLDSICQRKIKQKVAWALEVSSWYEQQPHLLQQDFHNLYSIVSSYQAK
mgnify:CR=1 FL=1